jgi:hypothetical protein
LSVFALRRAARYQTRAPFRIAEPRKLKKGRTEMPNKILKTLPKPNFDRHSRKCVICRHPDRAAIEEEFVHWGDPWDIAHDYELGEYRAVYRHAHAAGLTLRRRENLHSALDMLIENTRQATVSGDCIIRAIRAYSCVDSMGRWVDPPTQVNFSTVASVAPVTPMPPARPVISAKPFQPAKRISQLSSVVDIDADVDADADADVDENELEALPASAREIRSESESSNDNESDELAGSSDDDDAEFELQPDPEAEPETEHDLEPDHELETKPDPQAVPVPVAESGFVTHYLLVQPAPSNRRDGRTVAQIYGDAFRLGVNSLKT